MSGAHSHVLDAWWPQTPIELIGAAGDQLVLEHVGFIGDHAGAGGMLDWIGGATLLIVTGAAWVWRSLAGSKVRIGRSSIVSQVIRVGVRSIFIVVAGERGRWG